MRRALPLLLVVAVARSEPPPPTLAARKLVAERLAAKLGPVKVPVTATPGCFEYRPPAALGCPTPAFLCARSSGSGTCSGSYSEERGVVLYDHSPRDDEVDPLPELVLSSESGDDCPECECGQHTSGFSVGPGVSPAEEQRFRAQLRKEAEARHAKCLADTARRQQKERVVRRCQLLVVDPCRKEAFLRCTGKNGDVESGDPPLGRTLHFSWAPSVDGGVPRGGEWQAEE